MKEELVTLAKLAKEKGFKAKTLSTIWTLDYLLGIKPNFKLNNQCYSNLLSEIQKWLREVCNIDVDIRVIYESEYYSWDITRLRPYIIVKGSNHNEDFTYEAALEKGLQEALKLIK